MASIESNVDAADAKLAEADDLLRNVRTIMLAIASRAFDPEIVEVEDAIDRVRLLVAETRLTLVVIKEQAE